MQWPNAWFRAAHKPQIQVLLSPSNAHPFESVCLISIYAFKKPPETLEAWTATTSDFVIRVSRRMVVFSFAFCVYSRTISVEP